MRMHAFDDELSDPTFAVTKLPPLTSAEALSLAESYKHEEPGYTWPQGTFPTDDLDDGGSADRAEDANQASAYVDPVLLFSFRQESGDPTVLRPRVEAPPTWGDLVAPQMYRALHLKYVNALKEYQQQWRAGQEKAIRWWRFMQAHPERADDASVCGNQGDIFSPRNIAQVLYSTQGTLSGPLPERLPTTKEKAEFNRLRQCWRWLDQQGKREGTRRMSAGAP